jgi:hypothetical protein
MIFDNYEECDVRNRKGITDLNWAEGETIKRWTEIELVNGWALDVMDGNGLTEDELSACVETLEITYE